MAENASRNVANQPREELKESRQEEVRLIATENEVSN